MSAPYYLRSVAGGHHEPGAVIWGPYTLEDAQPEFFEGAS